MKRFLGFALGAALACASASPALASSDVVSVTFASVAALQAKNGDRIKPELFRFGRKVDGREKSARGSTNGFARSKEEACRWALLRAFLGLQRSALNDGLRVLGVRTYAGRYESADPDRCLCLAGGFVVRTAVRGTPR